MHLKLEVKIEHELFCLPTENLAQSWLHRGLHACRHFVCDSRCSCD